MKGIWIDRDIVFDARLTVEAKILLAQVRNLRGQLRYDSVLKLTGLTLDQYKAGARVLLAQNRIQFEESTSGRKIYEV